MQSKLDRIYEIKITLKESKPRIWRRFRVSGETRLIELHRIVQEVMGWKDCHLHQFLIDRKTYAHPDAQLENTLDERMVKLAQLPLKKNSKFIYVYDIGDSWEHELRVEAVSDSESAIDLPVCLAGEKACPPEDCGGIWGYQEFLKAIKNPRHEQHEEMMNWIDGAFDPDSFNLDAVNEVLRQLK